MNRRAFTLIELLVVLGIIAFIMAIIVPSLRLAREYAKSTRCSSNIKQITLNLIAYDLKNESFPFGLHLSGNMQVPPGGFLADARYDVNGWRWLNYICDDENIDIKDESVFWCPSRRIENSMFKNNVLVANYGVNQSICKSWMVDEKDTDFTGHPLSSADIKLPAGTLLIVDSGYYMVNWHHVTDSPPKALGKSMADRSYLPGLAMNKDRNLLEGQKDDAINGRHLNKSVNIGYADGHVERKKAEDLFVEKTADGYKNLSPSWGPRMK